MSKGIINFKFKILGTDGDYHTAMYGEWTLNGEGSIITGINGAVLVNTADLVSFQPTTVKPTGIYEG